MRIVSEKARLTDPWRSRHYTCCTALTRPSSVVQISEIDRSRGVVETEVPNVVGQVQDQSTVAGSDARLQVPPQLQRKFRAQKQRLFEARSCPLAAVPSYGSRLFIDLDPGVLAMGSAVLALLLGVIASPQHHPGPVPLVLGVSAWLPPRRPGLRWRSRDLRCRQARVVPGWGGG